MATRSLLMLVFGAVYAAVAGCSSQDPVGVRVNLTQAGSGTIAIAALSLPEISKEVANQSKGIDWSMDARLSVTTGTFASLDGVTIEDLDGVADAAVLETPIITDIWTNLSPYESLAPAETTGRGSANMIFLRETGEATVILLTTVDATDSADRDMTGIFAGIRTGAVSWLLEFDQITDSQAGMPDREQDPVFIEANWLIPQGHYLKLGAESPSGD